jgi:hypothetical protein
MDINSILNPSEDTGDRRAPSCASGRQVDEVERHIPSSYRPRLLPWSNRHDYAGRRHTHASIHTNGPICPLHHPLGEAFPSYKDAFEDAVVAFLVRRVQPTYHRQVLRSVLGADRLEEKWHRTPYLRFGYWSGCLDCEQYVAFRSRLIHL